MRQEMRRKRKPICMMLVFFLIFGLWTQGCAMAAGETPEEILQSMTTEEKISQMIMVSVSDYQPAGGTKTDVTVLPDEMAEYLTAHSFGGVILFGNSTKETEQTVRLIDSIQVANAAGNAKSQLLVSVDQEGGDVTRLNECVQGPGNMALTATGSDEDVTTMMSIIGMEASALGFNVDFCPDADVNNNPANPIIGIRSFSDDPEVVAAKEKLALDALKKSGVIGCPKHFPGHGDTATDSHTGLPCIDKSYDDIKELELLPFQAGIDQGVDMIMTAHIEYPRIETNTYKSKLTGNDIYLPATLSKTIITDILRGDMGYEGVVVTDAMNMAAIAKHFDPLDAVSLAINAGVDLLLMPVNIMTTEGMNALAGGIRAIAAKADADEEFAAKVDAAVLRILKLKQKYGLLTPYDGSNVDARVAAAKNIVSTRENHEIEWDITKRAITLVKNSDNTLPLTDEGEKTVILTAYNDEPVPMEYAIDVLKDAGRLPEGATYEVKCFRGKEAPGNRQEVLDWIEGADNVIAVSEMTNAGFLTGDSAGLLDELITKTHDQGGKFILMSVFLPYDAARFQEADAIMITYGARSMNLDPRTDTEPMKRYGPNIAAALYLMLQDEEVPAGKLPVNLPVLNETGDGYGSEILYARGTGLTYETAPQPAQYANEWVDGLWYDKNGKQTWKYQGSWKKAEGGWMFGDTFGWYAKNRWQKIDGSWYFFDRDGIMEKDAYRSGSYLTTKGAWDGSDAATGWKQEKKGWRYYISGKSYLSDCWKKIDGKWYYFHKDGYAATNEFVNGWWLNKNGICDESSRCRWHKNRNGWWYGTDSGWYARNASYIINGVNYSFDAKGYCTNP